MGRSDQAPALHLQDLQRAYAQGSRIIEVLKGATASLYAGETVALLGPSGAGKSTLLHIAGLLERPDSGAVVINGVDCVKLGDSERTRMRRSEIGFVYQFHHLLPEFSALENIVLPQLILGLSRAEAEGRASQLLNSLGISERGDHRPAQLSGGEQQRVAIARAVANGPRLLLADAAPPAKAEGETAEQRPEETPAPGARRNGEPAISPRARRMARELGVDWTGLKGSGRTGRIVERDVRQAAPPASASAERISPLARRRAAELGVDVDRAGRPDARQAHRARRCRGGGRRLQAWR